MSVQAELHRQCDDALVDASLDRALSVEQPSSVVLGPAREFRL